MNAVDPFVGIAPPLRAAIERRGFTELTRVQSAVLNQETRGKNLRISSETGSGKTLALGFVLAERLLDPAHADQGALVIAPTRELAAQVAAELQWLFADAPEVEVQVVTGGTDLRGERRGLKRRPRLIVGTPGRLLDHMRSRALDPAAIRQVVLDEADQMLDMGFRDELDAIAEQLPPERASHLVSATFPNEVLALARRFQKEAVHLEGTQLGVANAAIEHVAYLVRNKDTYAALVNLLLLAQGERCLVFVRRRVDATEISELLAADGFAALPFSGELAQAQRTRTLNAFRAGIVNTLISTDVAARGIDVPGISRVIHVEPPKDADVYVHRSGRTGRAGQVGKSLLLVPLSAERRVKRLLEMARISVTWQPVPSPSQVRKAFTKRTRRELHRRLDAAEPATEAELEYAENLLQTKEPKQLIATLLHMAEGKLPREPMKVDQPPPPRAAGRRDPKQTFVSFFVNYGSHHGATASRLLSMVCRRGEVQSHQVGAIRINRDGSVFQIDAAAAASFGELATRPDQRDPRVAIQPFHGADPFSRPGPRPHSGGPRRGPASGPRPVQQRGSVGALKRSRPGRKTSPG